MKTECNWENTTSQDPSSRPKSHVKFQEEKYWGYS